MRRLWLRWALLIVFVLVLGTVFVNLGQWQLDRLAQRQQRNTATVANEQAPTRPYTDVFTRTITDADAWQRVEARGTFDADHQFVVRYRQNGEADGYQVVTPLQTSAGAVLVDRGFVELPRGTPIPATAPAPPPGEVRVIGYVRRNEQGRAGAVQPVDGQVRLINSEALQTAIPFPVANGYLSATSVDPPQQGGLEPVVLPELDEGPHFWYAIQWFMFTAIGVLGIVVFIRADLRERRRGRSRSMADSVTGGG